MFFAVWLAKIDKIGVFVDKCNCLFYGESGQNGVMVGKIGVYDVGR